jgi:putative FmdB family regulatory protein
MPTYDYQCKKCGHRFEVFHSMSDDKPRKCPRCGKRAVRVPSAGGGLLFKGSGFYITDYRSSSYKEKAKSEGSGNAGKSGESGGSKKPEGGSGGKEKPGKTGGSSSKAGS